ncbi:MAG: PFL_4703 family integrating conjugative element protein [Parahaliea sp.]
MSNYDSLVHARDMTIRWLIGAVAVLALLLLVALIGWSRAPASIRLYYPPDLSKGAVQTMGDIPKVTVYTFAFYIFQQLNRWPGSGEKDYHARIYSLRPFLTPACYEDRMRDLETRRHEIRGRQRSVWEIPGRGFDNERVQVVSGSSWVVGLDLHVRETYQGERIKDRLIHYPLKVVAYDVDPELNPWGLAIDCLADTPRAIPIGTDEEVGP